MKIGLTYTGYEEKHQNYIRWLVENDEIEIIRLDVKNNNLLQLETCSGLVMSGGKDIHPKIYNNQTTSYCNAPDSFDEKRDEFEINVFKTAIEKKLPVMAVCRGMQLVNCLFGGTLQQDLGETLNKIHRAEAKLDKAHGISIAKGSLISEIIKAERGVVNSAHHQAIDKLGEGLKINCRADDGTIEGLEWANSSDKTFMLGIQWHPERMYKFQLENSSLSKAIRDRFIEEIIKSIASKNESN